MNFKNSLWLSISLLTACGSSQFQTTPPSSKNTKTIQAAGGEDATGRLTESFTAETTSGKVDIVWIVDQSGSMTREAANVQNNLAAFFATLNQKVDARYAVVASSTSKNAIKIPVTDANHVQVELAVASKNALEIGISMFIPADIPEQPALDSNNPDAGRVIKQNLQGALNKFFRPDVLPVIVIVTDDNASRVTDKNFLSLAKSAIGREPKLYAWRGNRNLPAIPGAQCDVAQDGIAYENLAKATGGEVFNLCEPDWKDSFSKLTSNIALAAKNSFTLKKPAKSILSVTVDGRALDVSKVTLAGSTVTLPQAELALNLNSKITIVYQP